MWIDFGSDFWDLTSLSFFLVDKIISFVCHFISFDLLINTLAWHKGRQRLLIFKHMHELTLTYYFAFWTQSIRKYKRMFDLNAKLDIKYDTSFNLEKMFRTLFGDTRYVCMYICLKSNSNIFAFHFFDVVLISMNAEAYELIK